MRQTLFLSLLVSTALIACSLLACDGQAEAGSVDPAGVTIRAEQPVPDRFGRHVVRCRIANGTGRPIVYTGYAVDAPLYRVQHLEDGQWIDRTEQLMCGTGLQACELAAGESAEITVYVTDNGLSQRVGLGFSVKGDRSGAGHVAWSNPIDIP